MKYNSTSIIAQTGDRRASHRQMRRIPAPSFP
jgi:hypothetical protein